ncbi:MAG: zinc ribbon domain-containing protein [Elusimicrobiota bacterium]|nr:zinc ribbon domain-containing protein [Elusimicrobiota bacterium]
MPIYEYLCSKCNKEFELLIFSDEKPVCPKCHNTELIKLVSRFSAIGVGKGPASLGSRSCATCPPTKSCATCR